jgi:4'-phosphopantetheinyl transferase EntD
MTMLAIVPSGVTVVESVGQVADAYLLPEEATLLGTVSESRRREFTTARSCARRALAELGLPPTPILPGPSREPLWPGGIVGSITHCDGYCAVAVARATAFVAVGIDAEPNEHLPDEVFERVTLEQERAWLRPRSRSAMHWDRMLFSAKESVFKAWFSGTGEWLDFTDVCLTIDPENRRFFAGIGVVGPGTGGRAASRLTGRYLVSGGRVLTSVLIERAPPSGPEVPSATGRSAGSNNSTAAKAR